MPLTLYDRDVCTSFVDMVQRSNRVIMIGDMFCKGAVYYGSNTHWSTRERANVGSDVPLIF